MALVSIQFLVVRWLHVAVIIIIVVCISLLCGSCGSILLSDSTFELIDSSLLEFLPHDFFLSEPGILLNAILIEILLALIKLIGSWSLWMSTFPLGICRSSNIWCSHIKHNIIKIILIIIVV